MATKEEIEQRFGVKLKKHADRFYWATGFDKSRPEDGLRVGKTLEEAETKLASLPAFE